MSNLITIGVDPGKTGAIALLWPNGELCEIHDMPIMGKIVSPQILTSFEVWDDHCYGTVIIEDVHAHPGQGVSSMFSFGRSLGVIEGVFAAAGKPIAYVSPAKWKKAMGLTADKGSSRRKAIERWPESRLFDRVKDDGRAEAALIALWWQQHGEGREATQ